MGASLAGVVVKASEDLWFGEGGVCSLQGDEGQAVGVDITGMVAFMA